MPLNNKLRPIIAGRKPPARTSGDDRIYINVRPLLEMKPQPDQVWHHITQWPPVEGERNWDRRNVIHALWIMADQVSSMEWVFCLKIRNDRPDDQSLSRVLEHIMWDLALQPDALLLSPSLGFDLSPEAWSFDKCIGTVITYNII